MKMKNQLREEREGGGGSGRNNVCGMDESDWGGETFLKELGQEDEEEEGEEDEKEDVEAYAQE